MKRFILLFLLVNSIAGFAQTTIEKLQGDWLLTEQQNIPFHKKDENFPKIQFLPDSILSLKVYGDTLQINQENHFFENSTPYTFRIVDDSTYKTTETPGGTTQAILLLPLKPNRKKKRKHDQEHGIEFKFTIIKATHSKLILEYWYFDRKNPFFLTTTTRYYFSKMQNDGAITEQNFMGNWFFCDYQEGFAKNNADTLILQQDSCWIEKTNKFGGPFRVIQKLTFATNSKDEDLFWFDSLCINCVLSGGGERPLVWSIVPKKEEILLGKKYRYLFGDDQLYLIKME